MKSAGKGQNQGPADLAESWPVIVEAETTAPNGRRVRMRRHFDEPGTDPEVLILRALLARRDEGAPFVGCAVYAYTPIHHPVVRIFDAEWGEMRLVKPAGP